MSSRRKKPHRRPGPAPSMHQVLATCIAAVAAEADVELPVAAAAVKHTVRLLPQLRGTYRADPDQPTDPRAAGGDLIGGSGDGTGVGDVLVDVSRAVLLHTLTVARVDVGRIEDGGDGSCTEHMYALKVEGRINNTADLASVLVLTELDGLAAFLSEILGLAARADIMDRLDAALDARLAAAGLSTATRNHERTSP